MALRYEVSKRSNRFDLFIMLRSYNDDPHITSPFIHLSLYVSLIKHTSHENKENGHQKAKYVDVQILLTSTTRIYTEKISKENNAPR